MENRIRYVETTKPALGEPALIIGIPDMGLAGSIASSFIFENLRLAEIGHFESELFPPMVVVHDKRPVSPLRLYANTNIAVLLSEMPIPMQTSYEMSKALLDWFTEKKGSLLISLGGLPEARRNEIEKPKVYGIATNDALTAMIRESGFEPFEDGLIVGTNGAILRDCVTRGLPAIYLMAESYGKYPDPGAAASLVEAVSKVLNITIDAKELIARGEEIRLNLRELMKQTQKSIDDSGKVASKEIPVMYR